MQRLDKAVMRGRLTASHALALRSLCHKLLAHPVQERARNPAAAALVPPHKLLRNAAPSCGLPVGNLTSQFFANVYLNELDQFVKHTLKVRHYVRCHPCREGIDFLGYHIYTHHRRVRARVVQHCRDKLARFRRLPLDSSQFAQLQAVMGSYWGHFKHANSVRLCRQLFAHMPWLYDWFDLAPDGQLRVQAPAQHLVRRHRTVRQILKPEGDE